MKKKKYIKVAKEVIDLEIKALIKLKKSINESFKLFLNLINAFISRSITSLATLINFFFFI